MGSIRRHRNGYMADSRVNGKRHRRVFPTKEEAEAALSVWDDSAAAVERQRRGTSSMPVSEPIEANVVTLGDVFDGWLGHKRAISGGKPGSIRNAKDSVRRLQRAFLRATPAMGLNGRRVDRSLFTTNRRVARDKKRRIEYELAVGDLHQASQLPLAPTLETFWI